MMSIPQTTVEHQYDKPQPNVAAESVSANATLGNDANIAAAHKIRVRKYRALGYAQHLLIKHNVRNRNGTNSHRTRFCQRVKTQGVEHVTIRLSKNDINSEASLGHVQTCGSIWACPVCASRKAVEKGKDVAKAVAWAQENGLIPVMVTITARHDAGMRLKPFKTAFKAAWRYFTNRRAWRNFKIMFGVVHHIANREVTRGPAGWHYHMHFLIFMEKQWINVSGGEGLELRLRPDWLRALEREGLEGIGEYALKVTAHGNVGEKYLTKLGLTVADDDDDLHYELSGSMNKKGSRTVWDILRHAYYGDEQSERLYIEYVEAMQGDNFITWSHGLHDEVMAWADENLEPETVRETMHDWVAMKDEWWEMVANMQAYAQVLDCAARYRSIPKLRELLLLLRDERLEQLNLKKRRNRNE